MENAREAPRVAGLAAGLGLSLRLLNDRLRERGFPSAARILLWGRLLRAAGMMRGSGARMESVAWKLGYSSASALRRALRKHTGLAGAELASSQSVDFLLESLVELSAPPRRRRFLPTPTPRARG